MRYTIGNNNPGPSNPSTMSQLFANTPQNVGKFTAHGAVADTTIGPLKCDITFPHWYGVRQTQLGGGKGSIQQGFCDASGNWIGNSHNVDQETAIIAASQESGRQIYWQAKILKAGDYTFQGGAG